MHAMNFDVYKKVEYLHEPIQNQKCVRFLSFELFRVFES